jgi:small subunit ribosomal protein S6
LRHYELAIILSPMLSQQEAGEAWTRIKEFITTHQGELTHDQRLGTRRLAYAIRKGPHSFLEGNYHLARFSTETAFNRELETFLRLDERVIRYLVVTTAPPKPVTATPAAAPAAQAAGSEPAAPAVAAEVGAREPAAVVAAASAEPASEGPAQD